MPGGALSVSCRQTRRWLEINGYKRVVTKNGHPKYVRRDGIGKPITLPSRVASPLPREVAQHIINETGYENMDDLATAIAHMEHVPKKQQHGIQQIKKGARR